MLVPSAQSVCPCTSWRDLRCKLTLPHFCLPFSSIQSHDYFIEKLFTNLTVKIELVFANTACKKKRLKKLSETQVLLNKN